MLLSTIKFYRHGLFAFNQNGRNIRQDALVLDTSRSSLLPDVKSRPPEVAPFELGDGELLKLQVFIDKSVVEVFLTIGNVWHYACIRNVRIV